MHVEQKTSQLPGMHTLFPNSISIDPTDRVPTTASRAQSAAFIATIALPTILAIYIATTGLIVMVVFIERRLRKNRTQPNSEDKDQEKNNAVDSGRPECVDNSSFSEISWEEVGPYESIQFNISSLFPTRTPDRPHTA